MSLLSNIETIKQYSKTDLENLDKSELISIVLASQFTINTLRTSSNWLNKESRQLKEEIKKKRRTLKTYDGFFNSLELNPRLISSATMSEFDSSNYSVKHFIEMQQKKICFQEQKIKELKIKKFKKKLIKSHTQRNPIGTFNPSTSERLSKACIELLRDPISLLYPGKLFEVPRFFSLSDERIIEHKSSVCKEFISNYNSLIKNYNSKICDHIITKRMSWDSEYSKTFKKLQEETEKAYESQISKAKLIKRLNNNSNCFQEGPIIREVEFVHKRISHTRVKRAKNKYLTGETEQDPDYFEILVNW